MLTNGPGCAGHDLPGFGHDGIQMRLAGVTLRVDLVDVLGAGRPGGKPAVGGHDFQAADRGVVAGARVSLAMMGSPASSLAVTASGESFCSRAFCVGRGRGIDARVVRRAEFRGELLIMVARILAGARGDLRRQQGQDRSVLVGRPDGAVLPQEAGPGALFAAEAERAVEQPGRKPLEPHRHFDQAPPQSLTTRSIMLLLTSVLPTAAAVGHAGRCASR